MPLVEVVEDRILDFGAVVIGLDATIVPGVEIQQYELGRVRITNKRLGKRVSWILCFGLAILLCCRTNATSSDVST